ncbi:MAG: hypothetical protein ABIF82_08605 [Planctomycetota bacterium]
MSDAADTAGSARKMPAFKSKKELIALAVSAVIFAFVIYKTYFGKAGPDIQVAELAEPAQTAAAPAGQGATAPPHKLLLALDLDAEPAPEPERPAKLSRDPFQMSGGMRGTIYDIKTSAGPKESPAKLIILTPQSARAVLAKIPGAEQAAAKGLKLDAVMITRGWRGASINGEIVPVGDAILGLTLAEVLEDRVILRRGKHRVALLVRPAGESGRENGTRSWRMPK